jgi:hypothetical protein
MSTAGARLCTNEVARLNASAAKSEAAAQQHDHRRRGAKRLGRHEPYMWHCRYNTNSGLLKHPPASRSDWPWLALTLPGPPAMGQSHHFCGLRPTVQTIWVRTAKTG